MTDFSPLRPIHFKMSFYESILNTLSTKVNIIHISTAMPGLKTLLNQQITFYALCGSYKTWRRMTSTVTTVSCQTKIKSALEQFPMPRRMKKASMLFLSHFQWKCDGSICIVSHVFQPLEVSIFGAQKEKFQRLLSLRNIKMNLNNWNDLFTIYELINNAYRTCINPQNAISGFRWTKNWSDENNRVSINKIKLTEIKNL